MPKLFKEEFTRDKYLLFALCVILLAAWIYTRADLVATLLTTALGALLGLVRANTPSNVITGGTDINVKQTPPTT